MTHNETPQQSSEQPLLGPLPGLETSRFISADEAHALIESPAEQFPAHLGGTDGHDVRLKDFVLTPTGKEYRRALFVGGITCADGEVYAADVDVRFLGLITRGIARALGKKARFYESLTIDDIPVGKPRPPK